MLCYGVLLVVSACAASVPPRVVAGKGIDSLRVMDAGEVAVYAQSGIGRLQIHLRAGESLELYLHYEEGRPLRNPEGLLLMRADGSEVEANAYLQHEEHKVRLSAGGEGVQWQLLFVDFYR